MEEGLRLGSAIKRWSIHHLQDPLRIEGPYPLRPALQAFRLRHRFMPVASHNFRARSRAPLVL